MFYSYEILQKRGGRFGNIWLAATNMSKLSRRDIASICIAKSCDDVLAYVEKRVPPSTPGGKRPRFSLYLSAQLVYGLTKIYQKQSFFLLLDATNTFGRVWMLPQYDIDLIEPPRGDLVTQPDITKDASLMMEQPLEAISDFEIPDENLKSKFWGLSSASERSSSTGSRRSSVKRTDIEDTVPVASVEQITLVDPPPIRVNTPMSPIPVPKEEELPPMNGQEMSMFLDMLPEARLSVEDLLPTSTPMNKHQDGHPRPTIGRGIETVTCSHDAIKRENMTSPILEAPQEKTPAQEYATRDGPRARAVPPSPGVTQQIITSPLVRKAKSRKSLQLELTPLLPTPARKRQKKHAVFADKDTQIPKTDQRQQLLTGSDTTRPLILEDPTAETVDGLLKRPSRKGVRPEVLTGIWAGTARFRAQIPEDELPPIESPLASEEERDLGRDLDVQMDGQLAGNQNLLELDQIQLPADITIPEIPPPPVSHPSVSFSAPEQELVTPSSRVRTRKGRKRTLEESIENLRKAGSVTDMHGSGIETPSLIERQRDASTSRLDASLGLDDTLILDESRKSKTDQSSSKRPRSSRSDTSRVSDIPASHTPSKSTLLYDLPEETSINQSLLNIILPMDDEFLLDKISENLTSRDCQTTTFRTICPPEHNHKRAAARYFTAMLNLAASRRIKVKQLVTYGDIDIRLQD